MTIDISNLPELGATFRSRGARKIYWAVVEGIPRPEQGRISMFLAKGEGVQISRIPNQQPSANQ